MEEKRNNKTIILLIVSTSLLFILLILAVIALFYSDNLRRIETEKSENAVAAQLFAEEELQSMVDSTIPLDKFTAISMQYGATTEFIQQFFDDALAYKEDGVLKTAPINYDLKQNDYDWNSLSTTEDRKAYEDEVYNAKLGIDVSKYQGEIDWNLVAADGIEFAIMRLGYRGYGTEGNMVIDEFYHQNMQGAIAAGIPVGVYFFSQATTPEEAVQEAELVISELKDYDISIPIIIDVEDVGSADARTNGMTPRELTYVAIAFCERIEEEDLKPMVYTNANWFFNHLEMERLEEYDKWLAQYYRKPFFPYEFDIWQYTNKGTVNGIVGDVDLNLCFTDEYFSE